MRLSEPATVHTILLYALPVVVAWLGFGVVGALFTTLLVAAAGVFVRIRSVLDPPDPSLVELHTITYSHYVEKVRWCLDRLGIAYQEVPSIGILGIFLTGRTVPMLVVPWARLSIGDSPKILRYLWGEYSPLLPPERTRFLEATKEALDLERHFDNELGIHIRAWSYWHLLKDRDLTLAFWGANEQAIPQWQRSILPVLHPVLSALLVRSIGINEAAAADGLVRTKRVFAEVDAMLADGRRYLMGGDGPTFVDITFASLAALALLPDGYAGERASIQRAPMDRMPPAWRAEIEALRETDAGRFVMRMYAEERGRRPGQNS